MLLGVFKLTVFSGDKTQFSHIEKDCSEVFRTDIEGGDVI